MKTATELAQQIADQELEACCEYLTRCAQWEPEDVEELRTARRPKPKPDGPAVPDGREPASVVCQLTDEELKETYWEAFKNSSACGAEQSWLAGLRAVARRALERLQELEGEQ